MKTNLEMKTTVNRLSLLEKLKENKETYLASYEEAVLNWQKETVAELRRQADKLENGRVDGRAYFTTETRPSNEVEQYDRVIGMLEFATDETVELGIAEADMYVRDNWDWKRGWTASNTKYLSA